MSAGVRFGEERDFNSALEMRKFAHENSAKARERERSAAISAGLLMQKEISAEERAMIARIIVHVFNLASDRALNDYKLIVASKRDEIIGFVDLYKRYHSAFHGTDWDFAGFLNNEKSNGFTVMQTASAYNHREAMVVFFNWGADFELGAMGHQLFWHAIGKANKDLARTIFNKISAYVSLPESHSLFGLIGREGVLVRATSCIFNLEGHRFSEELLRLIREKNLKALKCFHDLFIEENIHGASLLESIFSRAELENFKSVFLEALMTHGFWSFMDDCLEKTEYQSPAIWSSSSAILRLLRAKATELVIREVAGVVVERTLWDYAVHQDYYALLFYLLAFDLIAIAEISSAGPVSLGHLGSSGSSEKLDWDGVLLMDKTDVGRIRLLKLAEFLCTHESFFSREASSAVSTGMRLSVLRSKMIVAALFISEWKVLDQLFLAASARKESLLVFEINRGWLRELFEKKMAILKGAEHLLVQAVDQKWIGLACFVLDYFKEKLSPEVIYQAQCRDSEKGCGIFANIFKRNPALKKYCEAQVAAVPGFLEASAEGSRLELKSAVEPRGASSVSTSFVVRTACFHSSFDAHSDSHSDAHSNSHSDFHGLSGHK